MHVFTRELDKAATERHGLCWGSEQRLGAISEHFNWWYSRVRVEIFLSLLLECKYIYLREIYLTIWGPIEYYRRHYALSDRNSNNCASWISSANQDWSWSNSRKVSPRGSSGSYFEAHLRITG